MSARCDVMEEGTALCLICVPCDPSGCVYLVSMCMSVFFRHIEVMMLPISSVIKRT